MAKAMLTAAVCLSLAASTVATSCSDDLTTGYTYEKTLNADNNMKASKFNGICVYMPTCF